MSEQSDIQKVAGGAGIIFLGNALGMGLGFLLRIIPARLLPSETYGYLVLGMTLVTILGLFAHLGMVEGIARHIPRSSDPKQVFVTGTQLALLSGVLFAVVSVLVFPLIASEIATPAYHTMLRLFLLSIPLFVAFKLCISGFRGFEDSIGKVVTQATFRSATLLFVVLCILMFQQPEYIAIGWNFGLVFTAITGAMVIRRRTSVLNISPRELFSVNRSRSKSLLVFSLPLMLSTSSWRFMQETDTILISYFLPGGSSIGVYDTAFTLARGLFIVLWTFGFLFLPLWSRLHEDNEIKDMISKYQIITKWIGIFTLPPFLILISFPEHIITLVFGDEYRTGAVALQILAGGFFFHTLIGPNRMALTAIGKTTFILKSTSVMLVANLILNVVLIPKYGIGGAALSTLVTYTLLNVLFSTRLYQSYSFLPLSKRGATVHLTSFGVFSVFLFIYSSFVHPDNLFILLMLITTYGLTHLLIYYAIGIEDADREVWAAFQQRMPYL